VLEPGLPAVNPLDAWGTGNDADQIFAACIRALLDDPATGALALDLFAYRDFLAHPPPASGPMEGGAVDEAGQAGPGSEGAVDGAERAGSGSATLPHRGTRQPRVGVGRPGRGRLGAVEAAAGRLG
jgi:hypothetical protein